MTGAGSAGVAFAVEDSFETLPGTPTWYQPGVDVTVGDASLDRALTRARQPDDPRPKESREGNREGALSVSFTFTDTNFHELIFPESSNTSLATSAALAPTATWYLASDTITSTEERFLTGAAVETFTVNYQQGEDTTVDLTIIYSDEDGSVSTPSSISQPAVTEAVPFHATDLDIDATQVTKLQSFTLEITGMARFRRGQQQTPVDAVVGAYEPSLQMQAILEDGTYQELAYGTSGATSPQDDMGTVSGTVDLDNDAGDVTSYSLSNLKPTSYNWSDLVAPDTDITDPVTFHVTDVSA